MLLGPFFLLTVVICTGFYWLLPRSIRHYAAAACALSCLAWLAPLSALFCSGLTILSYGLIRHQRSKLVIYGSAIAIFFALLIFRELLKGSFKEQSEFSFVPWLGAAFFSLRILHCVLVMAPSTTMKPRFGEYCAYLFFPPTLLLGPFQNYTDFEREVRRSRFDSNLMSIGVERFVLGYLKIVIIGSYIFGVKCNQFLSTFAPSFFRFYLECLQYGFSLYAKFSGYSDIAIGFGLLLGIRLPENFQYPFFAKNIAEFWRNWHASVSGWCRDHVSFPIYASTRSAGVSSLVAMIVLGLWHECSSRYLLWGAYHGMGIFVWQNWQKLTSSISWSENLLIRRIGDVASVLLTFNFVVLSFAITRSHDLDTLLQTIRRFTGE